MNKWDERCNRLIEISSSIELGKLTILTGSNASGKSVIRKMLPKYIAEKLNSDKTHECVSALSFMSRAGLNSSCGINFLRDADWSATSQGSVDHARHLLTFTDRFLVLDEVELGMSEEMQLAIAQHINSVKEKVLKDSYGLLVITHSRIIASTLEEDAFFNIDGYKTKQEWLDRKIVPVDLDQFEKDASDLFKRIRDRSKGG